MCLLVPYMPLALGFRLPLVRDDLAAIGISWTSQALIPEISCDRSDLYGSQGLDTLAPLSGTWPAWHRSGGRIGAQAS